MAPVARKPITLAPPKRADPQVAADALVAECIPQLLEAGYEDRLLLSQDVCMKMHLHAYGGTGYTFVLEKFLPYLRHLGVTEEQVHKMMVANPRRVLTLVEPA